jgi:hypothetical protein
MHWPMIHSAVEIVAIPERSTSCVAQHALPFHGYAVTTASKCKLLVYCADSEKTSSRRVCA